MINTIKKYLRLGVKNSGSLFVLKLIGIFFNYLVLMLILHYYGFKTNGEYASFIALSRGIKIFIVFGLDYLIVKEISLHNKTTNESVITHITVLCINIISFSGLFFLLKTFFTLDIYLLYGSIFLALWRFLGHYFRGKNNMVLYGFFEFVLLQLTVLIALLLSHFVLNKSELIPTIIIINTVALIVITLVYIKKIVFTIKSLDIISLVKDVIRSLFKIYNKAIHFVLTNSISIISTTIMYTIIKSQYSLEMLGVYDTVLRFAQIVTLPLIATNGRVMTLASKYFNENNVKQLKNYIVSITRMLIMVSSFIFVCVIIFYYLYTHFYNKELSSYWLLFIFLTLAQLINNYAGPVGVILQVTGNEKVFNKITLTSALYLIISTIILTQFYSITVVGLNMLIYLTILNYKSLTVLKNKLNINPHSFKK